MCVCVAPAYLRELIVRSHDALVLNLEIAHQFLKHSFDLTTGSYILTEMTQPRCGYKFSRINPGLKTAVMNT